MEKNAYIVVFIEEQIVRTVINEDSISSYLSTSDYPDPELLIRTRTHIIKYDP